ncbi:hypothetical protein ACERK3_02450 [Phycisphaerales bacterium AB-hyl4]|uniref:DUF2946 domain-containing protein n=1 Tax=Natronomicrosphaera hydrolytica TaxID=3242702 RepID=A0ABV4U2R1_9BACT
MLAKLGRLLLILWLVAWFAVIIPGHQRGAILLPGSDTASQSTRDTSRLILTRAATCCPITGQPASSDNPDSPVDPATQCGICYLAGVIDLPTTLDLTPQPLTLLATLAPLAPEQPYIAHTPSRHAPRAPPHRPTA